MARRRRWLRHAKDPLQLLLLVVIAVMLVRMDLRQAYNHRMRSWGALYWGAVDASAQESSIRDRMLEVLKVPNLEMLSFCRFYGDS